MTAIKPNPPKRFLLVRFWKMMDKREKQPRKRNSFLPFCGRLCRFISMTFRCMERRRRSHCQTYKRSARRCRRISSKINCNPGSSRPTTGWLWNCLAAKKHWSKNAYDRKAPDIGSSIPAAPSGNYTSHARSDAIHFVRFRWLISVSVASFPESFSFQRRLSNTLKRAAICLPKQNKHKREVVTATRDGQKNAKRRRSAKRMHNKIFANTRRKMAAEFIVITLIKH